MPSPIYQYVINLLVSLPVRRGLGLLMNVSERENHDLNNYFSVVAKFIILTPLSLLPWCRLSFPTVGLKITFLPVFALKYPNIILIQYLENDQKPALNYHKTVFCIITFLLTWCMHIRKNDITPAISRNYM